jgi:hypothetical protein
MANLSAEGRASMTERQLKLRISQLSDEDLFKMVNEDIVHHGKEEITLAYNELDRRGLLPKPTDETPPTITRLGCLLGLSVFVVKFALLDQRLFFDKEILPWPRAVALCFLVALVASFWERTRRFSAKFWKHLLWSAGLVLLGSLALWDLPKLLRQRIPIMFAFGIPGALFAAFVFWLYGVYLPRSRQSLSETVEDNHLPENKPRISADTRESDTTSDLRYPR